MHCIVWIALAMAVCIASQAAPGTPAAPARVRWIAVGGGADPVSTQVSLEQDLALAQRVLGPDGVVLFAGGAHAQGVQVLRKEPLGDPLLLDLGALLDPRDGRESRYRLPKLATAAPATRAGALAALTAALGAGTDPLLLYVASHGEPGASARENRLNLWGGANLTVADLAALLDGAPAARPVRVVITACYAGGFADLAFAGADPDRGAAAGQRCGLFAAEWDQESSGCDANPNRREQEGYGIHFLHALRGEARDGTALPRAAIDFDGDGVISLLEAHTRVRIASAAFDVPTSTSERWLRQVAPDGGRAVPVALPEEDAVIAALSTQLGLSDAASARARAEEIERGLDDADAALADAEARENERYAALRIALLERWPVLDDPWHPDFAPTVAAHRDAIRAALDTAPEALAYRSTRDAADQLALRFDELRTRRAPVVRLVRAYDTRVLAGRLQAVGGPAWAQYQRLLACERSAP